MYHSRPVTKEAISNQAKFLLFRLVPMFLDGTETMITWLTKTDKKCLSMRFLRYTFTEWAIESTKLITKLYWHMWSFSENVSTSTDGERKLRVRVSDLKATQSWRSISRPSSSALWTTLSMRQRFATSSSRCTWSTRRTFSTFQSTTRSILQSTFATGCSSASSPAPNWQW